MKKIITISLLLPLSLTAQHATYILKGKIGNLNAPATVYLLQGPQHKVVGEVALRNGQFELQGRIQDPEATTLVLGYTGTGAYTGSGKREFLEMYLEAGTIEISSPDSLSHAIIKGSKVNADNEVLKAALQKNQSRIDSVSAAFRSLPAEKQDKEALAGLGNTLRLFKGYFKGIYIDFIKQYPGSYISLDALKMIAGPIPEYSKIAPLYNILAPEVKNTVSGKEYAARLERVKATAIGVIAPDFTQYDTTGKPVRLSDFRGRYVLVDFWASWCHPCRAENPNLVQAYNKYHEKGLEILGVSMDDEKGKEAWMDAIQKDGLIWKNVSDLKGRENAVAILYAIKAIPQNVLVDPSGVIIGKNLKGEALNRKLEEIFQ